MKNKVIKYSFIILLHISIFEGVLASNGAHSVKVTLDKQNWTYEIGEQAKFLVTVSGEINDSYNVSYEIGPEKMQPIKTDNFKDNKKNFTIDGGTMNIPGFLRCHVTIIIDGRRYNSTATAAFEPEKIKPTIKHPKDFDKFWEGQLRDARKIPLDVKLKRLDERCTEQYDVYQVSYQNNEYYNYSYGMLTVPRKEGKFPVIIRVPGAGVHQTNPETEFAKQDFITLSLYIHPFPGDWNKVFYDSLRTSSYIDYKFWGIRSKETFYYKRVITGCVKAVDVIYTLPQFDKKNLFVWGASQGGALSIITTALDKRIKGLVALCPAMCDYTGYLYGRAGGWPHYFNQENIMKFNNKEVLNTLPYYDVVNFARRITVPGFYSWGFNDAATPPTSFYSAFNVINAPRDIFIIPHIGHIIHTEQRTKMNNWITNFVNKH